MTSLSVVIPTLNCAHLIHEHTKSMQPWLDLADEIIAVDSDSEDGTPDIIRQNIRHSGLRSLNHPRGLYQSWNYAISRTTGKWIYISTIGDTITRGQLEHLMEAGELLAADVVMSPPEFVFEKHIDMEPPVWPVQRILDFHGIRGPVRIDSRAAFIHAARSIPNAILGSSASNLYRGEHLRARPFPTCFRMAGDTGWAIRHALETRFCYTDRVGSVFRFHSETYTSQEPELSRQLVESMRNEVMRAATENRNIIGGRLFRLIEVGIGIEREYRDARAQWGLARRDGRIPWYLRPAAIGARHRRNKLRKEMKAIDPQLDAALHALPLVRSC